MKLNDEVYGSFEISEPILLELLCSPTVLRLKKISQYGIPDKFFEDKYVNRFDHSVGVMLLLRHLGATLEEQIAGLLHDISHLAFSHVADYVFAEGDSRREDYHETIKEKFVINTEIPQVLQKFGYNPKKILNDGSFSILEQPIPDLCADRVDYALRQMQNRQLTKQIFKKLAIRDGKIIIFDPECALAFAESFLHLQIAHWASVETVRRYSLMSELLKRAIILAIIEEADFFLTDDLILEKIEKSDDQKIQRILGILKQRRIARAVFGQIVYKKFRYIDPMVLVEEKLDKVSNLFPEFKREVETARAENANGVEV